MRNLQKSLFLHMNHQIYSDKALVQCNTTKYGEPRFLLRQSPSFPLQNIWGGIMKTSWTADNMTQRHTRAWQEKLLEMEKSQQHKGIITAATTLNCCHNSNSLLTARHFMLCINAHCCTNGKRLLGTLDPIPHPINPLAKPNHLKWTRSGLETQICKLEVFPLCTD